MFECSLCKFKTDYPSEWKRHINKHQKLIRTNKTLYKEEHDKNKVYIDNVSNLWMYTHILLLCCKKKKSNNKPLTDYAVSKTSYPDIVFYLCISITIITPRTFSLFYLFLVLILADYINKNTQLSVCFFYILKILLKLKIKKNIKMSQEFCLVMGVLSLCTHLKGLLLLMVRRLYVLFDVCCEELRRYFNNIIDKSLFFLVIRSLANKMAKKWQSQSRFGEKESLFGEKESLFGEM